MTGTTTPLPRVFSTCLVAAVLVLGGCSASSSSLARPTLSDASVERVADTLNITWRYPGPATPVDVYVADSPDAQPDARALISAADADGEHRVSANLHRRQYIYLQPQGGAGWWVAERVLPLEGGVNFRDVGGYETASGKRVRWGKIYRSGTMADLTGADHSYLHGLGIRVMCDFRSVQERLHEPTDWQAIDPEIEYVAWDYAQLSGGAALQALTAKQARDAMLDGYRHADEFNDRYARMFDELARGNAPLSFNCSAGKDRTGRAAALILAALDVPRETIVADYALTEKVTDLDSRLLRRRAPVRDEAASGSGASEAPSNPFASVAAMPDDVRAVLMRSDPQYILAMFEQIDQDYGSVLNFLRAKLSVTDAELKRLHELYLED